MAVFKVGDLIKATGNGDERAINTQVTGSNVVKERIVDSDDLLSGDARIVELRPPLGKKWTIKFLLADIGPCNGATTGKQKINVYYGSADSYRWQTVELEGNHDETLAIRKNLPLSENLVCVPTNYSDFQRNILNLVITNSLPLYIEYENNTDSVQTRNFYTFIIAHEEDAS